MRYSPPRTRAVVSAFQDLKVMRRTLTGYYIGVLVVLAILNVIAWLVDTPRRYDLGVFSGGFLMGALGMYIAAYLYGYRK